VGWQPRKGSKAESKKVACKDKLTIARVPYAHDRATSGVAVKVKLPDGRDLVEHEVVVEDLFIVALGDSFASGESNPDRPVQFSADREMVYDPAILRASLTPGEGAPAPSYGLASNDDQVNPKVLPRRMMDDETAERSYSLASLEFREAFEKAGARWLSRDCHRSQYGYPFRVSIELALENRHRSVTLASLTCSGSEVTAGLFLDLDPREGADELPGGKVRAQLDQLSDLLCRGPRSRQLRCRCSRMAARRSRRNGSPRPGAHRNCASARSTSCDVDRQQRRGLRRARGLCDDGKRCRLCADRGRGRTFYPVQSAGLACLYERSGPAHEGAQGCVPGWLWGRAGTRVPVVLRADPVRRERCALRRPADARHGRASRPAAQQAAAARDRRLSARFSRPARMHRRQQKGGCPANLATAPAPVSRW
jgi:hypothetical protein